MTDTLHADVRAFRQRASDEVQQKAWVCAQLGIHLSAISNQGYAIHSPDAAPLLRTLLAYPDTQAPPTLGDWTLTTHVVENIQTLQDMGALCASAATLVDGAVEYVRFV
jgi:hypothetical protein